jgi:hypothetical protein
MIMKTTNNRLALTLISLGLSVFTGWTQQTEFKGLDNEPLGGASLQVDPFAGELNVSGIGTNGADGVSITTGGSGGATVDLGRFDPSAVPVGSWLRWSAIDPNDSVLQQFTVQSSPTGGVFFADFTGLGASSVSVALYSNNTLVATASGILPGMPVATFSGGGTGGGGVPIQLNPCILHPENCYGVIDVTVWQPDPVGPQGTILSLPGQGPMYATRMEISPGYPIPYFIPKYKVKTSTITASGLGTQSVANEGLVYSGLEHHALGQAQYSFDANGTLTVSNTAPTGDGVDIGLQNANTFVGDMVALNPQPLPPGPDPTIVTIAATGVFAGGSGEQQLGDLRVQALPVGLQIRADLMPGAGGSMLVELWQGGALMTSYMADVGGPVLTTGQGFAGVSVGDPDDGPWCGTRPPGPPFPHWWWTLFWSSPVQVTTPGGGMVMADHVRLSPVSPGPALSSLTHVAFQGLTQPLILVRERGVRNGLNFEGNQHFALGNATLQLVNGQLQVNNIGTSGADGVEIYLGRVNGSEVSSPTLPLPPPGGGQTYSIFADLDGIPDQPAGSMTMQMNAAGNLQVTGDFSAVGAAHFTVAVFNGDTLVARQTGLPSPAFTIQPTNTSGGLAMSWKSSPDGNGGYMHAVKDSSNRDLMVMQPFGSPVHGTRVVVIVEDPVHFLGPQSRVRVTCSDPTPVPWLIATEKLNVFGHGHMGLGGVSMDADMGLLNIANIAPGGTNGVKIDVGNSLSAAVTLDLSGSSVLLPHPWPWILATTAFGQIGGVSNQLFGSLNCTSTTGTVAQVVADFSPVGSTTQTIEVWNLGQLVQRIPGHSGPVGTISAPPVTLGVQDAGGPNAPGFVARFGQAVSIGITGMPALQGDTLLVRGENPTASVNTWQSLNLQAGGLDSLAIINESDTAAIAPPITGIKPAPGGGMQISIPTWLGYLYTLETTSVLGPQPLPWTPVQTFMGDGSVKTISLSNPAYVGGPQGYFRARLGNDSSGTPAGGGPVPDMIPPKHVYFNMDNVVVDEARDSGGDRPYFATILFQTQFFTPNSTLVQVVDRQPHDWVSKNEYNGNGTLLKGIDHMLPGDSLPIPSWMGQMEWDNLMWNTVPDLIKQGNLKPPIMVLGAAVVAIDNENTPPDQIHNLLTQLANGLQQQLVAQVESGSILSGISLLNPQQAAADLTQRFINLGNTAVLSIKPDVIGLLVTSIGNPDIPVGVHLLVMPVIPGITAQAGSDTVNIPGCSVSLNFLARSPENFATTLVFRGCSAAYRVNARIVPDFVPPPPPQNNNQPDPTLADTITISTFTGSDDLRSASTAQATIGIKGRSPMVVNLNDPNQGFDSNKPQSRTFVISPPARYGDIESITLHVVQGQCGGCTDDNWDVDSLNVTCNGVNLGTQQLLAKSGDPHVVRLVAKNENPANNEFVTKMFPFTH